MYKHIFIFGVFLMVLLSAAGAQANEKWVKNSSRGAIPKSEPPPISTKPAKDFDFRRSVFQESGYMVREWDRVCQMEAAAPTFDREIMRTQDRELAAEWKRLYQMLEYDTLENQLRHVNRLFNQWHYKEDAKNYGKEDYWASPREFIIKSGDCEDYAIIKYFALREFGVSLRDISIVLVEYPDKEGAHAVLVVEDYAGYYVLDNDMAGRITLNGTQRGYVPKYYINENNIWKHH